MLSRGEIYWASVLPEETKGHEQNNQKGQPRPWLIVSDGRTMRAGVVVACPLTTKVDKADNMAMFRFEITPDMVSQAPHDLGVTQPNLLLGEQIRVMSVERFKGKDGRFSRLGKLKPAPMAQVESVLQTVLDLTA
jgi:mRNA-degrading endonuclease toxin of MazEF toxin-antitoxin module